MIRKILLIIAFTLTCCQGVFAQQIPFYKTYNWELEPNFKNKYETKEPIVALNHTVTTEFVFEEKNKLVEYYLEHKTLLLNSDNTIEEYNKVYLPYDSSSEIIVPFSVYLNLA